MQAGALGGVGIEAIALAARTFQMQCQARRRLWAIMYVDVQAAFYRVVRESLYSSAGNDKGILEVLHAMKVPPAAIQELHNTLYRVSHLLYARGVGAVAVACARRDASNLVSHRRLRPADLDPLWYQTGRSGCGHFVCIILQHVSPACA